MDMVPPFVAEPRDRRADFVEEGRHALGRDFAIELPADEQACYGLDYGLPLGYQGILEIELQQSKCPYFGAQFFLGISVDPRMIWAIDIGP